MMCYETEPSKYDIHFATNAALHKLVENCKTYEHSLLMSLKDDETLG